MNTKNFITRTVVKVIAFAIITTIALSLLNSPVITNEIALGQMENSNELYILMEAYNQTKHFTLVIYGCVATIFTGTIIYDIYKFIQTKAKEKF